MESGEGNFLLLVTFQPILGDDNLTDQIQKVPRDTSYISPRVQNQIIECIGKELQLKIFNRVKKASFYVIKGNETTDVLSIEQLAVCFRYFDYESEEVREEFMAYIDVLDKEYTAQADVIEDDAFISKIWTSFWKNMMKKTRSLIAVGTCAYVK